MSRLEVPADLNRNSDEVTAAGHDHTGALLVELACRKMGLPSLAGRAVLDVGCGVRFTQAIINRGIEIGHYTGVDVSAEVIRCLHERVDDERFTFAHWDVRNRMYHPTAATLSAASELPVGGRRFDVVWLFSVFTHLPPDDAEAMLRILRRHCLADGRLFFTAFLDPQLEGFEDRIPEQPLLNAYYGEGSMRQLVRETGWELLALHDKEPQHFIQHHLVCRPA